MIRKLFCFSTLLMATHCGQENKENPVPQEISAQPTARFQAVNSSFPGSSTEVFLKEEKETSKQSASSEAHGIRGSDFNQHQHENQSNSTETSYERSSQNTQLAQGSRSKPTYYGSHTGCQTSVKAGCLQPRQQWVEQKYLVETAGCCKPRYTERPKGDCYRGAVAVALNPDCYCNAKAMKEAMDDLDHYDARCEPGVWEAYAVGLSYQGYYKVVVEAADELPDQFRRGACDQEIIYQAIATFNNYSLSYALYGKREDRKILYELNQALSSAQRYCRVTIESEKLSLSDLLDGKSDLEDSTTEPKLDPFEGKEPLPAPPAELQETVET